MAADGDTRRGALIAEGRTAQVFAWGPDRVVKVLRPGFPDELGEEEAVAARLADDAAIGAPRFHGMTRLDGRVALVYEWRDGASMMERLVGRPWRAGRLAAMLGELHATMHGAAAPSLPSFRDAVIAAVRSARPISGAAAHDAALSRIARLPDGSALCHGDFHPGNVMVGRDGPTVIDWLTASAGPPAGDVARTLLLLRDGRLPDELPLRRRVRIVVLRRWFVGRYVRAYRRTRPLDVRDVAAWRLPLLVARLDEGIEAEQEHLLRLVDTELRGSAREQTHGVEE